MSLCLRKGVCVNLFLPMVCTLDQVYIEESVVSLVVHVLKYSPEKFVERGLVTNLHYTPLPLAPSLKKISVIMFDYVA